MTRAMIIGLAVLGLTLSQGCGDVEPTGTTSTQLALNGTGNTVDLDVCAPDAGGFTLESTNPYFPIAVDRQWALAGEEDGELIELLVTILDETEVVAGVTTRVLEEREWADGELVEVSRNYVVEAADGTVCYFGEAVDDYEDGVIVGHEGAWRADEPGNRPGIMMPAHARPGVKFKMESAPGIAEDEGKLVGSGPVEVPAGTFMKALRLKEFNPLEGDGGVKVFVAEVGIVIDEELELLSYE